MLAMLYSTAVHSLRESHSGKMPRRSW